MARRVAALTCYFKVPGQMSSWDVLSRGSCFITAAQNPSLSPHSHHIVASAHVVSPFKYPNYFSDEWLKFVDQSHCKYEITLIDESERDRTKCPTVNLINRPFHHSTRDLAVLHADNDALEKLFKFGIIPLRLDAMPSKARFTSLMIDGFQVIESEEIVVDAGVDNFFEQEQEQEQEQEDNIIHVQQAVEGIVVSNNLPDQHLAQTAIVLTDGYCGAPVLRGDNSVDLAVGIVEGTVNENSPEKRLVGAVSYIPSAFIKEFLITTVEKEKE